MTATNAPELAVLAADVGTWDAEVLIRPSPGEPTARSTGVMINRLTCGGRWLVSDYRDPKTAFEGHGVYGYDPARRCFVGTWVDTERTFLELGEGHWDEPSRTMTYQWQVSMGGRTLRWREVTEKGVPDVLVFRSFMPTPDGTEYEMMTVTYHRRA
jgi:hypothetical protein